MRSEYAALADFDIGSYLREQARLPQLDDIGADLLVPFKARRLRNASVLWMNSRWLIQHGVDLGSATVREQVAAWLLKEYGFAVPAACDNPQSFVDEEATFYAERYGGEGMGLHGGSGRCGTLKMFSAKGIGRTPLVADQGEDFHTHGCVTFEEAIREAILSEVAAEEFPGGAVPVVAIIDPGLEIWWSERRAILIRPSFLRIAHLERATFFKGVSGVAGDFARDAARVAQVVCAVSSGMRGQNTVSMSIRCFRELFERIASQIAFGQVQRLFHGSYVSSNFTMDGALVDFGSARALACWSAARVVKGFPEFGKETAYVRTLIRSLTFHWNKYLPPGSDPLNADELWAGFRATFRKNLHREFCRLWGLDELQSESNLGKRISERMQEYFRAQQRRRIDFFSTAERAHRWLHDAITGPVGARDSERTLVLDIDAMFRASKTSESERTRVWNSAVRNLAPREVLFREELQHWIYKNVVEADIQQFEWPAAVERVIRNKVSMGRRHWKELDSHLCVMAQVSHLHSSALHCKDVENGQHVLWLECSRWRDEAFLFGTWISIADLPNARVLERKVIVAVDAPAELQAGHSLSFGHRVVSIPSMDLAYSRPCELVS